MGPAARKIGLIDNPDERTQHGASIPVIGGISIFIAIALSLMLLPFGLGVHRFLLFSSGLLMIVGVLDDHRDISAKYKAVAQVFVAGILVFGGDVEVTKVGDIFHWRDGNEQGLNWLASPLTVIAVVGVINAFNFIDGHDGLAASMFLLTAGALILLCGFDGEWHFQILLGVYALSVGVFLCFNLPRIVGKDRQIFLGDAGSMFLGLVLVYSLIVLSETEVPTLKTASAPWLLGLPLLDMCAVIILRLARRVSLVSADRRHIHHLLTRRGYSKKKTLLFLIVLQVMCCTIGVTGTVRNISDVVLFWSLFPTLLLYIYLRHRWLSVQK